MYISLVDNENPEKMRILLRESAFICEYVVRDIGKKIQWKCSRLNFNCVSNGEIREKIFNFSGCLEMDVPFNDCYYDMNVSEKTHYICEILQSGLKKYCGQKNIDYSLITNSFERLRSADYLVEFYTTKPCHHGNYTAKLRCIQDIHTAHFYVDLYHQRRLVEKIPFFKTEPDRLSWFFKVCTLDWKTDYTIVLLSHPYMDGHRDEKVLNVQKWINKGQFAQLQ